VLVFSRVRYPAFIAGAHHADVGGSLVVVDPARTKFDAVSGGDDFSSIEVLTPEVCFPEAPGWPKSYFHGPWPLSENYFLVGFSFEPLPGMGSGVKADSRTGLYYFDRFGNLELLYEDKDISCMHPIPLVRRRVPPIVPSFRCWIRTSKTRASLSSPTCVKVTSPCRLRGKSRSCASSRSFPRPTITS